jgi:hypothetical protein
LRFYAEPWNPEPKFIIRNLIKTLTDSSMLWNSALLFIAQLITSLKRPFIRLKINQVKKFLLCLGLFICQQCSKEGKEEVGIGLQLLVTMEGEGVKSKGLIEGFEGHMDDGGKN